MTWYEDVLGFEHLGEPRTVDRSDGPDWERVVDLLDHSFDTVRIGHLATGNQVGVELFEFAETPAENDSVPSDPGVFHVCVIDPDVEGLAATIDEAGGDHYSEVWTGGSDDLVATYCRDPWGNRIEITSRSYEWFQLGAASSS